MSAISGELKVFEWTVPNGPVNEGADRATMSIGDDPAVATFVHLDALLSPTGQALLARIGPDPIPTDAILRLGTALRRDYPPDLVAAAFTLHDLRIRAAIKFERAAEMLFTRPGLEQATAESLSRHRAARFTNSTRIADLCTGIGGDLIALAAHAPVLAVDRDPLHLRMASHNAGIYDVAMNVDAREADVQALDLTGIDAVFIDPARRTPDRRLGPNLTEPPLPWCFDLAERVPAVAIKAAPGIDTDHIPDGWEIEFVADERELKESVLWSPSLAQTTRRATVMPTGDTLLPVPGDLVPVSPPGAYLLDPNPAVTRAGLVEDLARDLGAWKIDDRIAFLSLDRDLRTPFARTLYVADSLPWHPKEIAARLRALGIGAVDIRRRGLPGDVEEIRRRFKLAGPHRATVVMTRVQDKPWCLICTNPD